LTRFFVFMLFLSCSGASRGVPSWVTDGKSKDFPDSAFIVGFGQGDTPEAAADRARAEIAKLFRVEVSQTTETTEKYTEVESAKGFAAIKQIDASAITEAATEKTLEGAEVALKYFKNGAHYALVALDRAKASAALREKIDGLKKELADIKKGIEKCAPLECVRGHIMAMRRLAELASLNGDYRIITGEGVWKPGNEIFKHEEAVRKILENDVAMGVEIENDENGCLSGALKGLLAEKGFFIRESPPYDVKINGFLKIEQVERPKSEYKWVRLELRLSAEKGDGTDLCGSAVNEEIGHNGYEQARDRALYLAKKSHLVYFIETLWNKLFGEIKDD